jgi:hypothetical protein
LSQAEKLEDPDESLFVFFPEAERQSGEIKKVGVKPIHKCCQKMKDQSVSKAILVVEVRCGWLILESCDIFCSPDWYYSFCSPSPC